MADLHRVFHFFTGCWHGYHGMHVIAGHGVTPDRQYKTDHYKCCRCGHISEDIPFSYLMGPMRIRYAPRGL